MRVVEGRDQRGGRVFIGHRQEKLHQAAGQPQADQREDLGARGCGGGERHDRREQREADQQKIEGHRLRPLRLAEHPQHRGEHRLEERRDQPERNAGQIPVALRLRDDQHSDEAGYDRTPAIRPDPLAEHEEAEHRREQHRGEDDRGRIRQRQHREGAEHEHDVHGADHRPEDDDARLAVDDHHVSPPWEKEEHG